MAYTKDVPLGPTPANQTQQLILDNFRALDPWGNGYGAFITQGAAPTFSGYANGLYSLNYVTTNIVELFALRSGMAGLTNVPITASKMSNNVASDCDDGWTYLPSGLLIKWGRKSAPSGTSVAVTPTVTSGGPNFSRVFRVFVTPQDVGTAVNFTCGQRTAADNTSGNFTAYINNPNTNTSVIYLVLGI